MHPPLWRFEPVLRQPRVSLIGARDARVGG